MSKTTFAKLNLKKENINAVVPITFNEETFEVRQYLPYQEKLDLIGRVILAAADSNRFPNWMRFNYFFNLEIIYTYTNIQFTAKQKEDEQAIFDLMASSGLLDMIIEAIPDAEYEEISNALIESVDNIYGFMNSAYGTVQAIAEDFGSSQLNLDELQNRISAGKDNITTLRDVMTKLG